MTIKTRGSESQNYTFRRIKSTLMEQVEFLERESRLSNTAPFVFDKLQNSTITENYVYAELNGLLRKNLEESDL